MSLQYDQYLRHDDNGISLTPIRATHMIRKDKLTYHLLIPVNSLLLPYYKYKLNSVLI